MDEPMAMSTSNEADNDPCRWSIDQVVNELCHNPTPRWSSTDRPELIPDRHLLEGTLRRNHVNGDNLLALDLATLKEDLEIASFGQRRAIFKAIEYFRAHSAIYQQSQNKLTNLQSAPPTRASPQISRPRNSVVPQGAFSGSGTRPTSKTKQFTIPHSPRSDNNQLALMGPPTQKSNARSDRAQSLFTQPSNRSQSRFVLPSIEPTFTRIKVEPDASLQSRALDSFARLSLERSKQEVDMARGKKKVVPTKVLQTQTDVADADEVSGNSYLSPAAVPIQDVFYQKIVPQIGDEFYRVPVVDDADQDHFVIIAKAPAGRSRIMAQLMNYFLRQPAVRLPHSVNLIKLPFSGRRLKAAVSKQYFTMFPPRGGHPTVQRVEDVPEVKEIAGTFGVAEGDASELNPAGITLEDAPDWLPDDILAKYPPWDERLELDYGDSDSEGAEVDDETYNAAMAEEKEKPPQPTALSRAEVESTIDETIEEMKQEWRNTKMPKVQLKAYRLWMQAARKRNRQAELAYVNGEIARFERLKNKIKKALIDNIWHSVSEVKKTCESIEVALFSLEEFEYCKTVLLRDTVPERPSTASLQKARVRKQVQLEEGEEDLESESELGMEESDAIVVEDSTDLGSIHHEADPDWNPVIPVIRRDTTKQNAGSTTSTSVMKTEEENDISILVDAPGAGTDADIDTDMTEDDIVTPMRRRNFGDVKTEQSASKPPPHEVDLPSGDSDLDRSPRLPKTGYREQGRTQAEPVDLTFSDTPSMQRMASREPSTDFEVLTPELNPTHPQTPKKQQFRTSSIVSLSSADPACHSSPHHSGLPKVEDVQGIKDTKWSTINAVSDRRRALAKAVYELQPETFHRLSTFVANRRQFSKRRNVIFDGLLALSEQDGSIKGVNDKDQRCAQLVVLLYMTYVHGQNMLEKSAHSQAHRDRAFENMESAVDPFYALLRQVIQSFDDLPATKAGDTKKRKRAGASSDVEIVEDNGLEDISSDPLDRDAPPSSHKKRKRKVHDSRKALDMQQSDQIRIQEQERRRQQMAKKLAQMSQAGDYRQPVNTTEPYIYLHPEISKRIKPHQLAGIQFMWREIIEDPKHQGCILAHTMGLGKTMQVISLLVTISLCSQDSDPKVRDLIPAPLRTSRTLVLCPASLVENWLDELALWTPRDNPDILGMVHHLHSSDPWKLRQWSKNGGVLVTSYERFRRMITTMTTQKAKGNAPSIDVEKILLEYPTLVVADEAHKLKNPGSILNSLAKRFKTTSRIALTGSPLNNHLEEYFTMVDWIAPGYLGTIVNFRSKYSEPINEGLYSDSTPFERRLCLRKLHVLKRDLDPKIDRADISAIAKDMPTKTEFFITVPLTELQTRVYNIYVKYMLETYRLHNSRTLNATIWDWISMLSWLCHHPSCFLMKLKERIEKQKGHLIEKQKEERLEKQKADSRDLTTSTDEGGDAAAAAAAPATQEDIAAPPETLKEDTQLDTEGPLAVAMREVFEILEEVDKPGLIDDPSLSYRTYVVQQILKEANANGDKTLLFTHSLPTLNYLERMLNDMQYPYFRLDGSTAVSKRQNSTKAFNKKDDSQVFLISMKAGGLGLNLQGANRVIIFDFSFNPSWEEQAIGRAFRLGQTAPVYVYRFQSGGTYEDILFNKAVFKTQLFGRVVDKKNPKRQATKSRMAYLFPVKDVPKLDFAECLGKDPKVLDVVIERLDCVRSIVLTETFQKEDDEELNEEERNEAEEEYRDQRLMREDPVAWQAKQLKAQADYRAQLQAENQARHEAHMADVYAVQQRLAAANQFWNPSAPMQYGPPVAGATNTMQYWPNPAYTTEQTIATPMGNLPLSSFPPPPFTRADFDLPRVVNQQAQQAPSAANARMAYDDTFQDFPQQPPNTRRATSADPDIEMD
ncbi:Transcriptional regulator ATRX [Exophiala dermatitidis]